LNFDVGLGIGDVGDPVLVDQEHRQAAGRAAVGRHRETVIAPARVLARLADLMLEQFVAEAARGAELAGVELRLHAGKLRFGQSKLPIGLRRGVVVEAAILLLAAQCGQRLGRGRDALLERGIQKGEEAGVFGRGTGGRSR
jgi:hypothetical protein